MTEDRPKGPVVPWYMIIIGTLLSWLGLAGLADGIVDWREWFEIGIFNHYRAVQGWFIDSIHPYIQIKITAKSLDYFILATILFRSSIHALWDAPDFQRKGERQYQSIKEKFYLVVILIIYAAFWPFIVTYMMIMMVVGPFIRGRDAEFDFTVSSIREVIKMFARKLLLFIPVLFVISDIGYTFGMLPQP